MLITLNDKISIIETKPTNIIKIKYSKYSCFKICNAEDVKIID